MNPPVVLTGAHRRTWQTIFQHTAAHNPGWHDVHARRREHCQVEERPNGNLCRSRG